MKKRIVLIGLFLILIGTISGCGKKEDGPAWDELEIIHNSASRIMYTDFDSLVEHSELIVIGEFIENAEQDVSYAYSEQFGKEIFTGAESTNVISVQKVLKGENVEPTLRIGQMYGVLEEKKQLVTYSDLTPMIKGEQWIFFLGKEKNGDRYWAVGDCGGRFPVPNDELLKEIRSVKEEEALVNQKGVAASESLTKRKEQLADAFGVYDANRINFDLYNEIIENFDCSMEE